MKLLRDTWLLFSRQMITTLRNPVWMIIGLTQPILFLTLFAPLLDSVAKTPGYPSGGALNVFIPGLLVQLGLFGTAFVGFGLIAELRAGVIERLRVTPVSRLALLLGRALRDIVVMVVQSLLLVVAALPFGVSVHVLGMLVMLGLLVLLGLVMVSCSYAIALAVRSEDALAPILNSITLPLMLLSGILLPMSLAPAWLRDVAKVNPLSHAVDAARALFAGHVAESVVAQGLAIMAVMAALAVWWAARSFRQATA